MAALQARLYAQDRWGLLLIFQAMDAAGKDGAIEHVMSGVNPQGCQVHAFKAPSLEELDHDFLWRSARALPERGRIGIFNRSYYEEVLIVRVHPTILRGQHVPHRLMTKRIWKERLEDIAAHERYLSRNGYVIRKFFLHVSQGRAEAPLPGPDRTAREELEVRDGRRQGAPALEGLHGGLRGRHPADRDTGGAVDRRPGRQQVVHPPGDLERDRRRAREASTCASRASTRPAAPSSPTRGRR